MRVLFDQGTPVPLRRYLAGHQVVTAYERGWSRLKNGDLLDAAERDGFEVFVTTDSNLRYQQNLARRRIAIVVLTTTDWSRIRPAVDIVIRIVDTATSPGYSEAVIPRRSERTKCGQPGTWPFVLDGAGRPCYSGASYDIGWQRAGWGARPLLSVGYSG